MYWFRNAIIYQLTKQIDFESIEKQLKECKFTPCGSADVSHFGWSAPLVTSENLAHQANGKILLVAKREEKILPVEVVNRELNKRITALEEKEQRKLKKVERLSLKDDVIATLLPQAFSRIKTTALYIDTLKQLIFVDAASSKTAEDALALLRKSLGSLLVVPLAFNCAPCEVMTKWVTDTAPDWLILREEVEIREKEDLGIIHCKQKDVEDEEIIELAKNGSVSKLALEWEDNLKFVLIEDGTLKRLKFDDNITVKNDDIVKEDVTARFDADFVLMASVLGKTVDSLIKEFGGIRDRL
ncbi:recombination-associated protein RdgC [Haemophilus aegyptius]|uniref:Recombination-associated protein RdgC n=2 Tax=Haemophilus TaxID=724 RepID=A0ABY1VV12_HAEAE|nr:recombination-associated protein RdgC [Haemophilus aegyptius]OBX82759.1 recombination-associated protein RdgC [Haemophilus aegyptius]UAK81878.1 recombination-associated protein RdgC [Haemophilus aegyptius]SQH37734.1 recombination associated protein [Haemophilus aegyptius]VEH53541.1 recombination associated protein [Haemophilus aegyptius]